MTGDLIALRRLGMELDSSREAQDKLIELMLKVRNKEKRIVRLRVNRAQKEYSENCSRRNIVLKARQLGITTYVAARFFLRTITQPGTVTVQVAHDQDSAEEIFKIVHRFYDYLPKKIREGALVKSRSSARAMAFPRLDSEYRVATAADANAGRGMTIHNLHCSEVARWPRDAAETLASLRAAVPENGEIVLESTPNGAGGVFYEEWQRAAETGYTRHFFPWWYDAAYVLKDGSEVGALSEEELALVRDAGLSAQQLAWRRQNRANMRQLAAQEFAEDATSCFLASGECVFDLEAIQRASDAADNPFEVRDNGRLEIYLPAQQGRKYVIGADPAGGGSEGDYSCATVIDRKTGLQCAELHGHFPPREFAARLIELGESYNEALLIVEKNNHGHGVLAHLQGHGYARIYKDGWLTSAVTRPTMIENLAEVLVAQPESLRSARLLHELRTFVRWPDGSAAAAQGTHDDCVMAIAIALAGRREDAGKSVQRLELGSLAIERARVEAGMELPHPVGKYATRVGHPYL